MEQLFEDLKYYIDLRIKSVKLAAVEKISLMASKTMSLVILIMLLLIALLLFTGALTIVVYQWVGSLVWAFVITGGFFVLAALVFYLLRGRIFRHMAIGTLSNVFFGDKHKEDCDDEEDY